MNSKKEKGLFCFKEGVAKNVPDMVNLDFGMMQVFSMIETCRGDTTILDDEEFNVLDS